MQELYGAFRRENRHFYLKKANQYKTIQNQYGEGEGEGEGEGVVSKEEEKKEIKKNQEEESPQPSTPSTSTNEFSIKEDTEALELLRNLTESERNPGAPPLILPTDVRERYARILKNAEKNGNETKQERKEEEKESPPTPTRLSIIFLPHSLPYLTPLPRHPSYFGKEKKGTKRKRSTQIVLAENVRLQEERKP